MRQPPSLTRRAAAEVLATFGLVFVGCGAAVTAAERPEALGPAGVAVVFGLAVMAMVYAAGHLSGAHMNPVVTLAFAATRHFPLRDVGAYIAAQCAGATAAALLLRALWPDAPGRLGATVPSIGTGAALVYEVALTAVLMFVVMAVATDTRAVGTAAAIAVGATVAMNALFGGPLTGASMNPARSLGPAIGSGTWTDFWIYLAGPLAGALAGAFAYQLVRGARPLDRPPTAESPRP